LREVGQGPKSGLDPDPRISGSGPDLHFSAKNYNEGLNRSINTQTSDIAIYFPLSRPISF
jgi:hypothetical protein